MTILAHAPTSDHNRLGVALDLTDSTNCPVWCVLHSPSDNGFVHYGDIAEVRPTGAGVEASRPVEVSVSCLQRNAGGPLDDPFILLSGPTESELTVDEALHLAGLLILAARRAVPTPEVVDDPHVICAERHHDGECPRRRVVAQMRADRGLTTSFGVAQ